VQRYVGETERLYGVLDARLKDRDWVVGPGRGKYTIADISLAGWLNFARNHGVDLDFFPNVKAWFERLWARPAAQRGLAIPFSNPLGNKSIEKRLAEGEDELKVYLDANDKFVSDAKAQYGYKYASP
jgi:glutathione S-transferase